MGRHGCQCGFSFVELVIVLVVFAILSAVAAPLLIGAFQSWHTGRDIATTDSKARAAIERMTRELRTIRAPADLTITSASDITFLDLDGNSIRYCQGAVAGCPGAAGELVRNSQPLADGVSALSFTFLTRAAAPTGAAAQVFYVTTAFTLTQNTLAKSYRFTVSPRNFP